MVQTLILTQGFLAEELLRSAHTINGDSKGVQAYSLDWDDDLEEALEKVRPLVEELAEPDGLLILTDMYGATPHNVARKLASPGRIEVVSGVNVPMVVRLCCRGRNERSVTDLAEWIRLKGQHAIQCDAGRETTP